MSTLEHTLVVPTFNRKLELRALLRYYENKGGPFPILVLDSSSDQETRIRNVETVSRHASAELLTFDDSIGMAEKIARGLERVATPTASLCADDDLVFVSGVEQAIATLDRKPELIAAHGVYLNFKRDDDDPAALRSSIEYQEMNPTSERATARLMQMGLHYESLFYATFRTPALQTIFRESAKQPSLHYQELFQTFAAVILGRTERLMTPYAGRHSGPAAQPERDNWQTYEWFASDPKNFFLEYERYKRALVEFFHTHSTEDPPTRGSLETVLDMAHATYFTEHIHPSFFFTKAAPAYPDAFYQDWRSFALVSSLANQVDEECRAPVGRLERLMSRVKASMDFRLQVRREARLEARIAAFDQHFRASCKTFERLVLSDELRRATLHPAMDGALIELARYCDIRDQEGLLK